MDQQEIDDSRINRIPRGTTIVLDTGATYRGPEPSLKGKTALVQISDTGRLWAQFDDPGLMLGTTPVGLGWTEFSRGDFEVRK